VRDKETGEPLPGVAVVHYHGQGPETTTDKKGRYELLGLVKLDDYALDVKTAKRALLPAPGNVPGHTGCWAINRQHRVGEVVDSLWACYRQGDGQAGSQQARVSYHPLGGNLNVNVKLPGSWSPRSEALTGLRWLLCPNRPARSRRDRRDGTETRNVHAGGGATQGSKGLLQDPSHR